MDKPKIGLLPLYVDLYDKTLPDLCGELEPFLERVVAAFQESGVDVVSAPICRGPADFTAAIGAMDDTRVDLIVTLHLAYSPSLASVEALASTRTPVLMLDTTPDERFGPDTDPRRILHNHGIHGLQDLACMLTRRGKDFTVVAGHLSNPETMRRATAIARGARAASKLRNIRALRIGRPFEGMGDFQVADADLHKWLGMRVDQILPAALIDEVGNVSAAEVEAEIARDKAAFVVDVRAEVHRRSVRLGLGLRRYLERGRYHAFSMNFLNFDSAEGPLNTVPFLECAKAMARGLGYAGEGDVLTAGLVAALDAAIAPTTFTEMFCPDWSGGTVFLSHMGEFNPALAAAKPRLYEKPFPFTKARNPVALACAPQPGPATLVNLAPTPGNAFQLIIASVEVLADGAHPGFRDWIRGWIKPTLPLEAFLEAYSRHGGTHHCALAVGDCHAALGAFARCAGLKCVVLNGAP